MNLCALLAGNSLFGALITMGSQKKSFIQNFLMMNLLFSWGIFYQIWQGFDAQGGMQFALNLPWLSIMGSTWSFALDGVSLVMVGLSLIMVSIVVVYALYCRAESERELCALFLVIQLMLIGLFSAQDAIAFFVFWEGVMFPMYLCIGIWGGEGRIAASMKFFIYTFSGSLLMLMGILYVGVAAKSFAFEAMWMQPLTLVEQQFLFWLLLIGMAVKTPMWPLHTWLPDAHTQAPTEGSVLLAALLLKAGTYAMLRLLLPVVPDACAINAGIIVVISLIAIIYVGMLTSDQRDMKRLIAYASISHMGFVTLGLFSMFLVNDPRLALLGVMGAIVVMVAHAFGSGALFLSFGLIYDQLKTRSVDQLRGLYQKMPFVGAMFMIYAFSTVGLPATAGFVGEWMVLVTMISSQWSWVGIVAATTMVVSVVYMLGMYKSVFFGSPQSDWVAQDLGKSEQLLMCVFAAAIFVIGLYPALLVDKMKGSVEQIVIISQNTKVNR